MKTKLFFFFAVLMIAFSANAQINSVALVGEAVGGWPGQPGNPGPIDINQLTQVDADNWIIENITIAVGPCKLRANNAWSGAGFEWAGAFPTAVGTSSGDILVPIAGVYTVTLNTATGVYNFESGTPLPVVKLIGACTGSSAGLEMSASAQDTFSLTNVTLLDGAGQFDIDGSIFGETSFPTGVLLGNSDNIPVVAGFYSVITVNIATGDYSFTQILPVSIVGDGVGGWPPFPGPDPNQLSSTDGVNYSLDKLACVVGPAKFRQNNDWAINWGSADFPSGIGTQGGVDIAINAAGLYDVDFNRLTGAYSFSIPGISIVGAAVGGWPPFSGPDPNQMTTTDGLLYTFQDLVCQAGPCKFRQNNDWGTNWGSADFPSGIGTQGGVDINIAVAGTYDITLNRLTGEYTFTDGLSTTGFDASAFKVFPNPTSRSWNFTSTANTNISSIQIVDVLGKVVMTINPTTTSVDVDASALNSGMYFAKVTADNGTETIKLMKN